MRRLAPLFGLLLCLSVSNASDTAAQRQGFIIGFGAGLGVTTGDVASKLGAAADLRIGAVVSESVQLYLTSKSNFFSEDGALVAAALHGLGLTHEWESGFNINGTAGVATWIDFDWATYVGFGLGVGVGYEFTEYWVVNLGGAWGRREDDDVFNISLTIGVLSH
jgi:hypothetical protein